MAISTSYQFNPSCLPYEVLLSPGKYKLEAYGAAGGGPSGGPGGYTAGIIKFSSPTKFFIYVGGKGEESQQAVLKTNGGCNGGGKGGKGGKISDVVFYSGSGGGGATDFRFNSTILSRFLVAGGGGGQCGNQHLPGAYGGGIEAGTSNGYVPSFGATQINGTEDGVGEDGRDGPIGTNGVSRGSEGNGGCGGGYRGGLSAKQDGVDTLSGGSGGSSYISGHQSCKPFPNIQFTDIKIDRGAGSTNKGNGYAKITLITLAFFSCKQRYSSSMFFVPIIAFLSVCT